MGPKIFGQNFSHIITIRWYFMYFVDLFGKKCSKMGKTGHFSQISLLWPNMGKMACFSHFWAFFAKQIHKINKIPSNFYDMRKILTKNFWSHGTPLGSLGSGSREALHPGACRFQILVIWGPYDNPVLVACHGQAKNPKSAGARCDIYGKPKV